MANKPLKILIVEDEFITAYHIGTILGRSGYEVAGNPKSGEDAIQAVLETMPDVILMDVKLFGEVDGIDAAAEIKKRFNIPVIYLTAYSDSATLARISQTNPYGYLLKPVNPDNLKAAIEISHSKSIYDRKLKESERRYLGIVENMPMYLCRFLPDTGEITFTNLQYRNRLGKEEAELIGTNFFDIVHGGNGAALKAIFESLTISRPLHTLEVVIVEEESRYWERWICQALYDSDGKPFEYQFIAEDISGIKEAETQIRSKSLDLSRTVTELDCIYRITQLAESDFNSTEEFLSSAVSIIADTLSDSPLSLIRIEYNGKEYPAGRGQEPDGVPVSPVQKHTTPGGAITIHYTSTVREERREAHSLITAISARMEEIIERITILDRMKTMEREILDIGEGERQNMGRELHDVLGQILTGISFLARTASKKIAEIPGAPLREMDEISALVKHATVQCRELSKGLLLKDIAGEGFIVAIDQFAAGMRSRLGINCELKVDDDLRIDSSFIATQLYRIIQEGITSAVKDRNAQNIFISIRNTGLFIELSIRDDGTPENGGTRRMGTDMMRYRANLIGADFATSNNQDGGFLISIKQNNSSSPSLPAG